MRVYRRLFADADIFGFEPVPSTFETLVANVGKDPRNHCFKVALSDAPGKARMKTDGASVRSMVVDRGGDTEVELETGDNFCERHGVLSIGYMKIDTEGLDLRVCKGFERMFRDQRIDLVQVEAGLGAMNRLHVPFQDFLSWFESIGYGLFRIYDQVGEPNASRCNPIFISSRVAKANPNAKKALRAQAARTAAGLGL